MHGYTTTGWRSDGRGFWTKRKKTATSLLSVLALVAGIAVAFKLFDRTVPNNVVRDASVFGYEIYKMDEVLGDTTFEQAGPTTPIFEGGVDTFPGDQRRVEVKIENTNLPARDASFQMHVDQDSIVVRGCDGLDSSTGVCTGGTPIIATTDPLWTRFVNFWELDVDKQKVLFVPGNEVNEDDHTGQNLLDPDGNPDDSGFRQYHEACQGALRAIRPNAPCELGIVRAAGTRDTLGEQTDIRYYRFDLTEVDDGTDQSEFKGWTITFTLVFNARVPALPEGSGPIGER